MDDAAHKRERLKFLQHVFRMQELRVRLLVLHESAQQKLQPNGWREISLLAEIAKRIESLETDAQRGSSQVSSETVTPEEPRSLSGALEKIKNLAPGERQLLREASEELLKFLKKELNDGKTRDPNGKEGNDKEEHRKDE